MRQWGTISSLQEESTFQWNTTADFTQGELLKSCLAEISQTLLAWWEYVQQTTLTNDIRDQSKLKCKCFGDEMIKHFGIFRQPCGPDQSSTELRAKDRKLDRWSWQLPRHSSGFTRQHQPKTSTTKQLPNINLPPAVKLQKPKPKNSTTTAEQRSVCQMSTEEETVCEMWKVLIKREGGKTAQLVYRINV